MPQGDAASADGRVARSAETAEFFRRSTGADLEVLTVRGELDISTAARLQQELAELLDIGTARVAVDLSGVVFMDSSALSALVAAHERAALQSQRLTLSSPSPACAKVLGITGLDRIFDLT
jgi:anti-sigma B factor antagonist